MGIILPGNERILLTLVLKPNIYFRHGKKTNQLIWRSWPCMNFCHLVFDRNVKLQNLISVSETFITKSRPKFVSKDNYPITVVKCKIWIGNFNRRKKNIYYEYLFLLTYWADNVVSPVSHRSTIVIPLILLQSDGTTAVEG